MQHPPVNHTPAMRRLPRVCENRKFASFAHTFGLISPAFCVRKPEICEFRTHPLPRKLGRLSRRKFKSPSNFVSNPVKSPSNFVPNLAKSPSNFVQLASGRLSCGFVSSLPPPSQDAKSTPWQARWDKMGQNGTKWDNDIKYL